MKRIAVWVLTAIVIVVGLSRLRFDADPLNLLPGEVPSVAGLRLHQSLFSGGHELLITIAARSPESAARFAGAVADDLRGASNLVFGARWQFPLGESAAENVAWMWLQQPPEALNQLADRWTAERLRDELAGARERLATSLDPGELAKAGYDPLGLLALPGASTGMAGTADGMFASESGLFRVVMVEPRNPRMQYGEATAWLAEVRQRVEAVRRRLEAEFPGDSPHIALTGGPAFLSEIANGMQADITTSVLSTLTVIALLFWIAHRSFRPLVLLVVSLAMTLLITLALGGLLMGTLNVIGCGFAAVMMGLVVDYGLVGYQELRAHPGVSVRELRRLVLPGVGWSAVTTAGTFLSLGLAGLPGLAELGVMTAIGLLVGATVMLFGFLPGAVRSSARKGAPEPKDKEMFRPASASTAPRLTGWITAAILIFVGAVLAIAGWPRVEGGADPLRPRNSPAYAAMNELQRELGRTNHTTWLLFRGDDPDTVLNRIVQAEPVLALARSSGAIQSYNLPAAFWPAPVRVATNRVVAQRLASGSAGLSRLLQEAGFTTNSFALAGGVLGFWEQWTRPGSSVPLWPENDGARWISGMTAGRLPDGSWVALGIVESTDSNPVFAGLDKTVLTTGWDRLGPDLLERVRNRVIWMTGGIALVLTVCLWLAFRRWSEVALGLAGLALSFGMLLAVMSMFGATWNLLNLVAVPLVLGTSVDSVIHVQLAMRRHGGDMRSVWRTTGVALLLCAGANVAGFGSLAWSSNAGLASLDLVCAGGVICVLFVTLLLLPRWWQALHRGGKSGPTAGATPAGPSNLYGPGCWRIACFFARNMPRACLAGAARFVTMLYRIARPDRVDIVARNLLPVVDGDHGRARRTAVSTFAGFAEKLVDLWRYEAGVRAAADVEFASDLESFSKLISCENGVVLVTPHLGNWELGGSMLVKFGVRPLVLSAPEPGAGLTEMRARARALHGVDTLVVGTDPFAFVEVIKRLQAGGVVALLVDRPAVASGVEVEFMGRPFVTSVAAAELARATGCRILPVYVVREEGRYRAHFLPPVEYDRVVLGSRDNRRELAARILRVFEPVIRRFPDQWFHFVPVWKDGSHLPDSKP